MLFKLFSSTLERCINRILATTSMEPGLNRYPLNRQKFEPTLKIYHRQKCDELRYPQLAMAEVKIHMFEGILREK
jgi:hypothetical protein